MKSTMKIHINIMMLLLFKEITADTMKKLPAFATPKLSSSYLPATMQVIFHAVEQLKQLQQEGMEPIPNIIISSSPHPPGLTTWQIVSRTGDDFKMTTASHEMSHKSQSKVNEKMQVVTEKILETKSETTETYTELPEVNDKGIRVEDLEQKMENVTEPYSQSSDVKVSHKTLDQSNLPSINENTTPISSNDYTAIHETRKLKTDSIVAKIHEIVNPLTMVKREEGEYNKSLVIDKAESDEDETDESRFSFQGEKGTQVARPSLANYLRLSKVPLRASLQQLASLYDALSKDARKQGFASYAGYSDEVLKTLETSLGGGIGPQLKKILEKTLERNELTREDSKNEAKKAVSDLADYGSYLSTDLRRLLPLRYRQ